MACQTFGANEPNQPDGQPDADAVAPPSEPDARPPPEPDATQPPDAAADAADAAAPIVDAQDPEDVGSPDAEAGVPDATDPPDAGNPTNPRTRARVMFSGHSLLDRPLPDDFELIATSLTKDVNWNQQNIPGSPLRARTRGDNPNSGWGGYSLGNNRNGSGMNIINELLNPATLQPGELYDSLIVTDRNDLLEVILWENTIGYLRHYHDRMIDGNPQSTTYLYQVWRAIDKSDHQRWIDFTRDELTGWECVASKVNLTLSPSAPDSIHVIPGGLALVRLVEEALAGTIPTISGTERERLDAIFQDDVHLNRIGIYYMAAVHFATVFNQSPVGAAAPAEVPASAVPALQRLAWDVVSSYDHSGARSRSMATCRTAFANDICPEFYRLTDRPQFVDGCSDWMNQNDWNPFVWPDPNWSPLPAP